MLGNHADVGLAVAEVEIERRGQRRGQRIAELVEKDEAEHQQRPLPALATDELVKGLDHRLAQGLRCPDHGGSSTSSTITMPGTMKAAVIQKTCAQGSRSARISDSDPGTRPAIR
jgi:hypothetical protein